jgi:exonuclease III
MESADADVACVTETHTRAASKLTTCGRNGEDTVLNQTRESRTGHSFGGVAVIVRAASTRITSAQITSCCPSADVMTVRLTDVNGGEHDIVATYIPPNQAA